MARKSVRKTIKSTAQKGSSSDDLKNHLAKRLPEMLSLAIEAYDRITAQPAAEDPRAFTAQQGGAKAALAHMEALLKLAQAVMAKQEPTTDGEQADNPLTELMARAREAVDESADETGDYQEEGDQIGGAD